MRWWGRITRRAPISEATDNHEDPSSAHHEATAGRWVDAGPASAIESDSAVVLDSDATGLDDPIALFHTADGEFYCIDDTCTHEDASLAAGWLEDCTVECPVHLAAFCLRTGAALTPPASEAVRTYPVRVTDGHVWVLVEQ